jgi:hypothetical protein
MTARSSYVSSGRTTGRPFARTTPETLAKPTCALSQLK